MEPGTAGRPGDMAAGDGGAGWMVDSSDPEIAIRESGDLGDSIPRARQTTYTSRELGEQPNYVSSQQPTEVMFSQQGNRGGRKDIIPEKFAGKVSWSDYLRHFEVCKDLNGWTDLEAGQYLASRLQGAAIKVLNNTPAGEPISFRTLVKQLEKRFGPGHEAENFLLELRCRRRGKDETLQQLGQAIRDLTSLAYPEMTGDVRERLARTHFAEAIDDTEIRAAIFRAHPKTLDDAITAALATESFLQTEKMRERFRPSRHVRAVGSGGQTSPTEEKMTKEIQGLKSALAEMKLMMENMTVNKQNRFQCYNCGEPGHMKYQCTKPQMGNGNWSTRRATGRPANQHGPQN